MPDSAPPDGRAAKWILLLTLLIALAAKLASGQEAGEETSPDRQTAAPDLPAADLYQKAKRALVEVLVDGHLAGSGWFTDAEGLLFTAGHVVGTPGRRVEVLTATAGRVEAEVVAVDLGHDLALLRVEKREGGYPTLPLAGRVPPPGEETYLLGTPLFRHALFLRGMVAKDEHVFSYSGSAYVEVVHVAATVQGGTSGGPWLNRGGEVVGLQSGVMSMNAIPVGIAFMIPCDALQALLKDRRTAATPTMRAAVEELWQHGQDVLKRFPPKTEGLVFRAIQKDGPADRAGLKEWDAVVAADGQKVRLAHELLRILRGKQPGEVLKLTILGPDGTGTREVEIRLGKLEAGWPEPDSEKSNTSAQ